MSSSKKELAEINPRDLAADTTVYTDYLAQVGLPTDNIIATTAERSIVAA